MKPILSIEELENAYQLRAETGLSMLDICFRINNNREEGNRISNSAFNKQLNNYITQKYSQPGKIPQSYLNDAFLRDLFPDAWSKVKSKLNDNNLTIGEVDVCDGVMYMKNTIAKVVESQFGYHSEIVLKNLP